MYTNIIKKLLVLNTYNKTYNYYKMYEIVTGYQGALDYSLDVAESFELKSVLILVF